MNPPPSFPPFYFVKRGKALKNRVLPPPLFAEQRGGQGGEFMRTQRVKGGEFMRTQRVEGGEFMVILSSKECVYESIEMCKAMTNIFW
jgi:hypothetical protein